MPAMMNMGAPVIGMGPPLMTNPMLGQQHDMMTMQM